MDQQFAALFTALRQKLASSDLANARSDDGDVTATSPSHSTLFSPSRKRLHPQQPHHQMQPENQLILQVQSSFLDQRKALNSEYSSLVNQLDTRLARLQQLHKAQIGAASHERECFAARVSAVQQYVRGVLSMREWHDRNVFFGAHRKIQLLLQQCRGEISKETRRLRAHNRVQAETLSSASTAVRQLAAFKTMLALLVHDAGDTCLLYTSPSPRDRG